MFLSYAFGICWVYNTLKISEFVLHRNFYPILIFVSAIWIWHLFGLRHSQNFCVCIAYKFLSNFELCFLNFEFFDTRLLGLCCFSDLCDISILNRSSYVAICNLCDLVPTVTWVNVVSVSLDFSCCLWFVWFVPSNHSSVLSLQITQAWYRRSLRIGSLYHPISSIEEQIYTS